MSRTRGRRRPRGEGGDRRRDDGGTQAMEQQEIDRELAKASADHADADEAAEKGAEK